MLTSDVSMSDFSRCSDAFAGHADCKVFIPSRALVLWSVLGIATL